MSPRFEIEYVNRDPKQAYVVARKLEGPSFFVGEGARLHGAAVISWNENVDAPGPDACHAEQFAFALRDPLDISRFSPQQVVTLEGTQSAPTPLGL